MFLLINILLLLLTGWLAFRLISAAYLRAHDVIARPLDQPVRVAPQTSIAEIHETSVALIPSGPDLAASAKVLQWSQLDVPTARDAYADPIDGVPFAEGEEIHECECGVGYRTESVKWLADYLSGRCVHCGATVEVREAVGV